jgi:dTDP-4-amino-4,6-dideoxygalactose transaminase
MKLPPWPLFENDEIAAATAVLRTGRVNYWTGEECRLFEKEFAKSHGVARAIAVSNGSVAIGMALRALQLPPNSEVIVTPRTFVATVSEIVLAGHTPIFADVDRDSQNLTVESIAPLISDRTAAIVVVHLAGWPCDMRRIVQLAAEHDLRVVEDCAQAHGATIDDGPVGSWGDIATFSFCQDKIMTTGGEGGMVVTNSEELWSTCWSFKDHGKSTALLKPSKSPPVFRYVHDTVGTNFRMTEMQAAIGRIQLRKLSDWVERRRRNALTLAEALAGIDALRIPRPPDNRVHHAYYKFYAFLRPEKLKPDWNRDRIVAELLDRGVPCGSGICPEAYLERAFRDASYSPAKPLPVAAELGQTSLMFVVHPTLSQDNMHSMADAVKGVLESASL